jgi:pimeloyl-ACP methyl ester carboxylesterase
MIQNILQDSNRVDIFKLACQAMIDMDLRPLLPNITAPTLIIGGDEDMMTPWNRRRAVPVRTIWLSISVARRSM